MAVFKSMYVQMTVPHRAHLEAKSAPRNLYKNHAKLLSFVGTKRNPSATSRALSSYLAMMRLLLGRRFALVSAMALIRPFHALRFPPFTAFMNGLRGDGVPAASKSLIGLSSRKEWSELRVIILYDRWRRDAEQAEKMHREYPNLVPGILDTMRRKQQVHSGDRSHPLIRRLDALTPTLSYNGWKDDARAIEWPRNGRRYYHAHQVEEMFELMRTKQEEHDGVRDHKNLRELDDLVARLATNMQVPSASAPVPEASTSAVLWDADTPPIQRLVEEVLAGKLVCSGLLGTSASSNSSEKDDSRQVSGPCDTASSGQGESSSGDRSLRQSAGHSRPAHGDRVAIDSNGLHAMPGTSRRDDGTVVAKSLG